MKNWTACLLAATVGGGAWWFGHQAGAEAAHEALLARVATPPTAMLAEAPKPVAIEAAAAPSGREGTQAQSIGPVVKLYQHLGQMLRDPRHADKHDHAHEGQLNELQTTLIAELASNPQALQWAIRQFRANLGTPEAAQLGALLGTLNDPEIVQLAQSLQTSGQRSEQLAGLELAARLQVSDPSLRAQALSLLQEGGDRELAAAALFALKREPTGPQEQQAIVGGIQRTVNHGDAEVRRRSAIALSDWAADPQTLGPVIAALSDPSVDVRAGAAFALGRSRVIAPQAEGQLVARMSDPQEDWTVRDMAFRALQQYPLSQTGYSAYQRFASTRAALAERQGSGGEIAPP
jgi:hypothetical protein